MLEGRPGNFSTSREGEEQQGTVDDARERESEREREWEREEAREGEEARERQRSSSSRRETGENNEATKPNSNYRHLASVHYIADLAKRTIRRHVAGDTLGVKRWMRRGEARTSRGADVYLAQTASQISPA